MHRNVWSPLLEGQLRERALATTLDIEGAVRRLVPRGSVASLAGGSAGIALFYAYLSRAFPGAGHDADAEAHLDRAVESIARGGAAIRPSLYAGFTGIAWTLEHLGGRLLEPDGEDPCLEIDDALSVLLHRARDRWDYDLVHGLVGLGVYALERLPRPGAAACLTRIVAILAETAEETPDGITWRTSPAFLPPSTRGAFPAGCYNAGLAHGVPGVIALLGAVHGAGLARPRVHGLLVGATSWLLAQELDGRDGRLYPSCFDVRPSRGSRKAWCYGDPGVAAALFAAGISAGLPHLRQQALRIARFAAIQPHDDSGVVDAGVCHGAAGLAHIYHRLYRASGDEILGAAARAWTERLLDMREPGSGVGGYLAWNPDRANPDEGAMRWEADPGFLCGAAGVGLVLLSLATPVEPAWDKVLFVGGFDHEEARS